MMRGIIIITDFVVGGVHRVPIGVASRHTKEGWQ